MAYPFRLHPEAREELEEAIAWYTQVSPKIGQQFLNLCYDAIQHLAEDPDFYAIAYKDIRKARIHKQFHYNIFYRINQDEIVILAIFHDKRHPRQWQKRS